ncbi:predicted protein [Plenodomus lingam JN3]|uniref:Uncharacterized protein n=1 Tax=Leptosphaeria maculans (strain JN3 / isolate v23.1.3 / race Av1-4-5-6-7-8) TaxID=985895 RepID=M1ZJM8_LEPMJ|nr:predicted protein [Plenodomus lingam JN3]
MFKMRLTFPSARSTLAAPTPIARLSIRRIEQLYEHGTHRVPLLPQKVENTGNLAANRPQWQDCFRMKLRFPPCRRLCPVQQLITLVIELSQSHFMIRDTSLRQGFVAARRAKCRVVITVEPDLGSLKKTRLLRRTPLW